MPPKRKQPSSYYSIDFPPDPAPGEPTPSAPAGRVLQQSASVQQDGRIIHSVAVVPVPASPSKPTHRVAISGDNDGSVEDLHFGDDGLDKQDEPLYNLPADDEQSDDEAPEEASSGRELRDSEHPLKQWVLDHRSEFLDDGCSDGKTADHRCVDCMGGGQLLCRHCIVRGHAQLPLHRIQVWTGEFFSHTTLWELGLRLQLGHWEGNDHRCPLPEQVRGDSFVIIDDHGVHDVAVDFCGCGHGGSHNMQLLRGGLYPATTTNPCTAATFAVLRYYHLLSFESKASSYEFYHTLAREMDNTSLNPPKNRYHEWRHMTCEWRNLQMLKRAGRGHDPTGLEGTKPGECALKCPACPQPGKNLPRDWETASEERKFLYALFLAMDANFRLKRKDVSSEDKDPGLGPGWAFYCEVNEYMSHVDKNSKLPQERSRCVAHDAVDRPDKEARGTASLGIGAIYQLDYMLAGIKGMELQNFYMSYDIACQWHIHLWARMSKYDPVIQYRGDKKFVTFLVPKFHLPAHIESCNLQFLFNLMRWVGQTDGESPERGWANANPLAGSTAEMGPGFRRDTLDDHFNDWNYKKIIAFGQMMSKKMLAALPVMVESRVALADMEESLDDAVVAEWTDMAEAWEQDRMQPNPFETRYKDAHLSKVQYELAQEAAAREEGNMEDEDTVRAGMHINECIAMGVQLEDQQCILGFDVTATGLHPTDDQRRVMVERMSKLRRRILAWMVIQTQFFPSVTRIHKLEDDPPLASVGADGASGHDHGGSGLQAKRAGGGVPHQQETEEKGVKAYTRSQGKIESLNEQVRQAERYRGMRSSLVVLGRVLQNNEWEVALRPLAETDVRGMLRAHFGDEARQAATRAKKGKGKGRGVEEPRTKRRKVVAYKVLSWIWLAQKRAPTATEAMEREAGEENVSAEGEQPAMDEALRIEWAKTRARSLRWSEEVQLLEEEMRRIVQYLEWQANWWTMRVGLREDKINERQQEGYRAYALRQALLKRSLAASFTKKWEPLTLRCPESLDIAFPMRIGDQTYQYIELVKLNNVHCWCRLSAIYG
ncbi:hypothetical protein C8J57DRAFT_1636746 [Mycena rebaudengoi]|nr:hypothetical protein C8J57DRAFT_1636746 [Mycena rebaudengoi]